MREEKNREVEKGIEKSYDISGWISQGETYTSVIPTICPKCGRKLKVVDSLQYCNMYMVYCVNYKCRYCEIYKEDKKGNLIKEK